MPRNELFIGSLPRDVSRRDIENIFDKYGRIERCDIKNRGKHSKQKQQRQETFYLFKNFFSKRWRRCLRFSRIRGWKRCWGRFWQQTIEFFKRNTALRQAFFAVDGCCKGPLKVSASFKKPTDTNTDKLRDKWQYSPFLREGQKEIKQK